MSVVNAIIEAEDVILRSWREADRAQYDEHCNTDDVMSWLGGKQTPEQLDDDIEWFRAKERDFGVTFWVVERKSDQAFLGWCGLIVVEEGDEGVAPELIGELEIGWRFRSDVRGLGYAKQSAIAVLDYAFTVLAAKRVISTVSQGNGGSWGLMLRLGMKHDFPRDYGPVGDDRMQVFTLDWRDWDKQSVQQGSHLGRSPQKPKIR